MPLWTVLPPLASFRLRASTRVAAGLLVLAAIPAVRPAAAQSAPADTSGLAAFRADPLSFFFGLRTADAIRCGQIVLAEAPQASPERKEVLTTLAAIYLASGRRAQASAAVHEMLAEDPRADLDRPELLPPPLVDFFYGIRDSMVLAGDEPVPPDIRTLAVGDIENNSIVSGKYDLNAFAKGLTQIMITDLSATTPLKLVDRSRLQVLRSEIQMNHDADVTDPRYRVPLGKLTGAQSFLFGSVMQVDPKKIRLDLRWVDTSTGEVLLADGVEAKLGSSDDLFQLERKVLLDLLVPRIEKLLSGQPGAGELDKAIKPYLDRKKKELPKGTSYVDLLLSTGKAILAEERGDYAAAQTAWAEAGRLDPGDDALGSRALALNAYVEMNGGQQ